MLGSIGAIPHWVCTAVVEGDPPVSFELFRAICGVESMDYGVSWYGAACFAQ